jgi:hypothetical protein
MFGMEIGTVLSILAIGILVVGAARLLRRWAHGNLRSGSPWALVDWLVVSLCVLLPLASFAYLMLAWSSGSKR